MNAEQIRVVGARLARCANDPQVDYNATYEDLMLSSRLLNASAEVMEAAESHVKDKQSLGEFLGAEDLKEALAKLEAVSP